jgi:hypothetical protein
MKEPRVECLFQNSVKLTKSASTSIFICINQKKLSNINDSFILQKFIFILISSPLRSHNIESIIVLYRLFNSSFDRSP